MKFESIPTHVFWYFLKSTHFNALRTVVLSHLHFIWLIEIVFRFSDSQRRHYDDNMHRNDWRDQQFKCQCMHLSLKISIIISMSIVIILQIRLMSSMIFHHLCRQEINKSLYRIMNRTRCENKKLLICDESFFHINETFSFSE